MAGKAVVSAEFMLWPADASELRQKVARLRPAPLVRPAPRPQRRLLLQEPAGQPAWKLLDAAGLRGYQIGGAQFSEKHCNFMINAGGATAADVAALKQVAQRRVLEAFGIELENEVALVGEGFGEVDNRCLIGFASA